MQFIRRIRGRNRIKAMISIALTISIALSVFAIAGSAWVTSVVSDYAVRNYAANVAGVAAAFDREVSHFETIATQMADAEWVKRVMFMQGDTIDKTRANDYSFYEPLQQMRTLKMTNSLISEIGVLFFEKDTVIAAYGKSNFRFMAENSVCVDGMSVADWRGLGTTLKYGDKFQLHDANISHYRVSTKNALFIYPIRREAGKQISAALFVTVPYDSLTQYFRPLLLTGDTQQAAFTVSASESAEPFLSYGTVPTGKTQKVAAKSNKTGWKLAVELPESIVLTGATRVRNILLMVVLGIWLLCMLASLLITNRFFFPIERIVSIFTGEDNDSLNIDEYEAIRKGIEQLHDQRAQLKSELAQRQPVVRAACLQQLLTNNHISDDELKKICGVLDLVRPWSAYCICMMLPMDMSQGRNHDLSKLDELIAQSKTEGKIISGIYNTVQIMLLCVDDKQEIENVVVEVLSAFVDSYLELGDIVNDVRKIPYALQTALTVHDYRLVSEGFRLQRYDPSLRSRGLYYLPLDAEHQLLQAVRNGNAAQALAYFDNLYSHNESQPQLAHVALRNFLMNIYLDVIKLTHNTAGPSGESGLAGDALSAKWKDNTLLETIHADVRAYIQEVALAHKAKIQSAPTRLEDIVAYIKQNLFDSSLSLTMVADAFGVSKSVVSRLFSEQHNENFLSYINRLRIDSACECLTRDSQMDILAIAKRVGYDNDVTFRRLFKKYVGLTPTQYRARS